MPTLTDLNHATRRCSIALVGNPNTGKTTVFNALTGFRQRVGNYPGITVEKKTGPLAGVASSKKIEILDLPGTYSLTAQSAGDDGLTLDVLLGHQKQAVRPDVVVCVADASNLRRNLFLVSQALELGCPVVVALTMTDLARAAKDDIDRAALAGELGVPVIPVIAAKGEGVSELKRAITGAIDAASPTHSPRFPSCVSAELDGLAACIHSSCAGGNDGETRPSRVELLQTLLNPDGVCERRFALEDRDGLPAELADRRQRIKSAGESLAEVEARVRYAWIDAVITRSVTHLSGAVRSRSDLADKILTHRVLGLMVLVLLMGGVFQSIYTWAVPLMDGIDVLFGWLGGVVAR